MRKCKVCGFIKPLSDYYSAHTHKCKECVKAAVRKNRAENIERYREFDQQRSNLPHRVEARAEYAASEAGILARRRAQGSYMARNPERREANTAVSNALRDGRLFKLPCWECGSTKRVEGHHPAYSMPLDVIWLCKSHHQKLHNEHDDYENANDGR